MIVIIAKNSLSEKKKPKTENNPPRLIKKIIIVGALRIKSENKRELETRVRIETAQMIALLQSAKIVSVLFTVSKRPGKETENWQSEEALRPTRLQCFQSQPEYLEESWKPQKTCCHSDFSENHHL